MFRMFQPYLILPLAGVQYGAEFLRSLSEKEGKDLSYFSVDEDYLTNMKLLWWLGNSLIPKQERVEP